MFLFDFFDKEKDCQEDLRPLKEQYFNEVETLKQCKYCEQVAIREKYIDILVEKWFSDQLGNKK